MTAAFLLMSSVALAGADPAPAAPAPAVSSSAACGCAKVSLLDKLKSKFGKKSCDCAPVPACAPVHVPPPCAANAAARPNLLDKLKSRCGHNKASACGPVCDPCGAAPRGTPPKEMPKPKSDEKPKTGTSSVPVPLPPVSGAGGLTGSGSPY